MVTVVLTADAVADLARLPTPVATRMHFLLARLRQWPNVSGVKHLRGNLAGKHRLRTGDYRLQFRVEEVRRSVLIPTSTRGKRSEVGGPAVDFKVIVEKAGHRDGFYDE